MVYTMYMYTIAQFRKNMRQAFNDAAEGHEVVIERYGQNYQLVGLVDKALPGHGLESTPGKPPVLKPDPDYGTPTFDGPWICRHGSPGLTCKHAQCNVQARMHP